MKYLLLFFCFSNFGCFAQIKDFKLTDTSFVAGQEANLQIKFLANQRFYIDSTNIDFMDSLKNFVLNHSNLKFEIQCNTDYRGDSLYNLKLTEVRANEIKLWLEHNGANPDNLQTNSEGERKPFLLTPENSAYSLLPKHLQNKKNYLLSEAFLKPFKTTDKKLFDTLNYLNQRTVFRILSE